MKSKKRSEIIEEKIDELIAKQSEISVLARRHLEASKEYQLQMEHINMDIESLVVERLDIQIRKRNPYSDC